MSFATIVSGMDAAVGNRDVFTTVVGSDLPASAVGHDFKMLSRLALHSALAARQGQTAGTVPLMETGQLRGESEIEAVELLVERLVGERLRAEGTYVPEAGEASNAKKHWRDWCPAGTTNHWIRFSSFSFHFEYSRTRIFSTGSIGNIYGVRALSLRMSLSSVHLQRSVSRRQEIRLPFPLSISFAGKLWRHSPNPLCCRLLADNGQGEGRECGEAELAPGRRRRDGGGAVRFFDMHENRRKDSNSSERTALSESLWKWQDGGD